MSEQPAATAKPEKTSAAGIFLGGFALAAIYGVSFGVAYFVPSHQTSAHTEAPDAEGEVEGEGANGDGEGGTETGKDSRNWDRTMFDVPTLVVNLMGTGGKRYAKVGITIEFAAQNSAVTLERVKERLIPLRDRLMTRISSETLDTVDDPERKERLRMDILASVREVCFRDLEDASVLRIYYREFIIQ